MERYTIIATSTFGLESVVAGELRRLGYNDLTIENGKVTFSGDPEDIARCNIWLRTADRILIKAADFEARDFEELFQGARRVRWGDLIPLDGRMHVAGRSVSSKLFSVKDCQSIVKKAVIEAMKGRYGIEQFPETGPLYKIEIAIRKDVATLTVDTTGHGLHKRGYREETGEAPLRENLAAALVLLSRWRPDRVLADPFCGSGTIPIEAAMIGKNIAPGLKRSFSSESWPQIPQLLWDRVRREARNRINGLQFRVLASDNDFKVLKKARENAGNAGVGDLIAFQKLSFEEFRSRKKYGFIICNPPYGERMGDKEAIEKLYKKMGEGFSKLDTWSFFILSAHPGFQAFFGKRAAKNRKLYNGGIKCYLYEYQFSSDVQ
ncbi:MAG TPA: class I SAM-dependent RNA methyltransferase [Syntrophorhabdaceae bacterium]|nr:class I SAM-dependent RNA methyltransferase [Syntrophorhabdaceae bacterium]HQM81467.1 class I SAM-dependent RNA methyltransferase [Syntrophorhabdaceae bacterium]